MKPTITTKVIIFLKHKQTGLPVRLAKTETNSTNCCGEYQWKTEYYTHYPIWYAESVLHAQWVINNATSWYNSNGDQPDHSYEPEELEVCQRTEIVSILDEVLTEDNTNLLKEHTLKVLKEKRDSGLYKSVSYEKIITRLISEAESGDYSLELYDILK